jgi:predicted PurR-regulated permease PerM
VPEPEIRLTNPTKASAAAGFNMRSSRETGGAGRFPLQTAFGLLLGIAVLYLGRGVLIPIALALLLSFFLSPAMVRLQRWGLGKTFAALLVVGFSFSALILVCWAGLGQAYNLSLEIPAYRDNIVSKLRSVTPRALVHWQEAQHMLGDLNGQLAKPNQANPPSAQLPISVEVREPAPAPLEFLEKIAGSVLGPLSSAVVVLVFVIFILLGREDLRDRVLRLAGSSRLYMTTRALDDAAQRVSRYLMMQFAVNVSYGAVIGFGLMLIGIPHPLVWGLLTAVLRFIPYVGPWIAAAGPLLLAIGVGAGWGKFGWTLGLYVILELLTGNAVEPFLYGSSTGISAIAILIAAVFWTWLWGPIGLLVSTPLTVCLVVVGRYVPHLEFLGILFGDEPALSPAQRFYQRMIAMEAEDAAELAEQLVREQSLIEVYDTVIIPAISLAEEGRHGGFLDSTTAAYFLENTRELTDEISSMADPDLSNPALSDPALNDPGSNDPGSGQAGLKNRPLRGQGPKANHPSVNVICLPARDAADELVCHMFAQLLPGAQVQVLPLGILGDRLAEAVLTTRPELICILGVPPQATRHVAVRCRHMRRLFPNTTIMAAVWSDADLASLRKRIPVAAANHIVCTLKQAVEYVWDAAKPPPAPAEPVSGPVTDTTEQIAALELLSTSQGNFQEVVDHILQDLAHALDATIATLTLTDDGKIWKAQCGVPPDLAPGLESIKQVLDRSIARNQGRIVIEDIAKDSRFAGLRISENGIHFCAQEPLLNRNGKPMGSLLVLDTRTRRMGAQEEELLHAAGIATMEALEVRAVTPRPES